MRKSDKAFDSVRLMRRMRDALSKRMQGLTFEQQHKLIKESLQASDVSHAEVKDELAMHSRHSRSTPGT